MEKSRTSLMNIGRMRTINFETAKKKKVVIITDHTGTDVVIFDQGIATSDFLASNYKNKSLKLLKQRETALTGKFCK